MINLIVTIFGGLMIIAGFYAMTFGFATPPDILLFFLGLILAVAGLFLVIIFSSGIEFSKGETASIPPRTVPRQTPVMQARPKPVKVEKKVSDEDQKKDTLETIEKIKPQPRIKKPKKVDRPEMSVQTVKDKEETPQDVVPSKTSPETIGTRGIKPTKKDIGESSTLPPDAAFKKSPEIKKSVEKPIETEPSMKSQQIKPVKKYKTEEQTKSVKHTEDKPPEASTEAEPVKEVEPAKTDKETEFVKPKPIPRIKRPVKPFKKSRKDKKPDTRVESEDKADETEIKPAAKDEPKPEPQTESKTAIEESEPKSSEPVIAPVKKVEPEQKEYRKIKPVKAEEPKKPPVPKRPDMSKLRSKQADNEDEYVKKRLEKMKESYIQNAKDIEGIIDERLDSFKGTLGKLKNESKEPGIIWSFDAGDVQEAMKDTIAKANTRILMMYPWIRNIDVGILKKFMDTESCIIVQEASLDDDASVELLRLLQDKNVKIRTMPHVHTIAVVSDETSGLIISTDPIYESYEVGVVYKDLKSIEEIERLFEDAWEISQDVDLEIK